MAISDLIEAILARYPLSPRGIHGVGHWARVQENGLRLASACGARADVIRLFAVFHDSQRHSDGGDPGHGRRGAELAGKLRGTLFELDDGGFQLLLRACDGHTGGRAPADITVAACWDADRLDLARVGIRTNPRLLCTAAARDPALLSWASRRAVGRHVPREILREWGLGPGDRRTGPG